MDGILKKVEKAKATVKLDSCYVSYVSWNYKIVD